MSSSSFTMAKHTFLIIGVYASYNAFRATESPSFMRATISFVFMFRVKACSLSILRYSKPKKDCMTSDFFCNFLIIRFNHLPPIPNKMTNWFILAKRYNVPGDTKVFKRNDISAHI